jgi:hypothetical protein
LKLQLLLQHSYENEQSFPLPRQEPPDEPLEEDDDELPEDPLDDDDDEDEDVDEPPVDDEELVHVSACGPSAFGAALPGGAGIPDPPLDPLVPLEVPPLELPPLGQPLLELPPPLLELLQATTHASRNAAKESPDFITLPRASAPPPHALPAKGGACSTL